MECEWESGDWKWGRKVSGVTLHFSRSHSLNCESSVTMSSHILWNYCHRFTCYFLFFQIFFVTYSDFIENNRFFCRVHHSLHSWILFNYVSTYQIRGSAFFWNFHFHLFKIRRPELSEKSSFICILWLGKVWFWKTFDGQWLGHLTIKDHAVDVIMWSDIWIKAWA